jgi:homoserine dehydrogenase
VRSVREPGDRAPLKVALLGCGVVGSQVYRLLTEQSADLQARTGAPLQVVGVAVRDPGRSREVEVPDELLTTDGAELVTRPDVDIVIELIGGIEPARELLLAALKAGKSVITANKALVASHRAVLHRTAEEGGAGLYYEASVAGAIPLLRPLRESLAGDEVRRILGIVNGTTNFILDRMDSSGADFGAALAEAQSLGYAEADPTADVAGFDAASKAAILASIAFHTEVTADDVYREGILSVTAADIASARALGFVVKLLAICERCNGGVTARVHPAMIPREHPLAAVRDAYNAVFVEASPLPARCSETPSRSRATCWPACAARTPRPTRRCQWCRSAMRSPGTTCSWTSRTGPACWRRSPMCSRRTGCRSRTSARTGAAMTRT